MQIQHRITLCGNFLSEMEEVIDHAKKHEYGDGWASSYGVKEFEKKLLLPFMSSNERDISKAASLFKRIITANTHCAGWHADYTPGMVICSHPTPVQILRTKTDIFNRKLRPDCNFDEKFEKRIEKMIASGEAELITPNPGDIYRLEGYVIHRRNPASIGHNHLCLRRWFTPETV